MVCVCGQKYKFLMIICFFMPVHKSLHSSQQIAAFLKAISFINMVPKASTLIRLSCFLTKKKSTIRYQIIKINRLSIYLIITKHYFIYIMNRVFKITYITNKFFSSRSVSRDQNCDLECTARIQANNCSIFANSKWSSASAQRPQRYISYLVADVKIFRDK